MRFRLIVSAVVAVLGLVFVSSALAARPVNTAQPVVSGTAQQGSTLTTTNGLWSGSVSSYRYSWYDCNGTSCSAVAGATSKTYALRASDVGFMMRSGVQACNSRCSAVVKSVATAVVTASQPPPPPPPSSYPPDQHGLSTIPVQSMPMPGYLSPTADPTAAFAGHAFYTRVSDVAAFGASQNILSHNYSKIEPWNSDGSLVLLDFWVPGQADLIDGAPPYTFLRHLNLPDRDRSARWSNVNPDNLYGVNTSPAGSCGTTGTNGYTGGTGNQMVVTHPESDASSTPAVTVLHTFSQYDQCGNVNFGLEEGNFSADDSVGVVLGWSSAHDSWGMTTFDMTNTSSATPSVSEIATYWFGSAGGSNNNPNSAGWNTASMTPNGDGVVMDWNTSGTGLHQGTEWYDPSLTTVRNIDSDGGGHYDIGLDGSGNEVLVAALDCFASCDGIPAVDGFGPMIGLFGLDSKGPTATKLNLMPYTSGNAGRIHVSLRDTARPGWAYISDVVNDPSQTGYQQLYALKLDGSQTVEAFGADHGSYNPSVVYKDTARVVPSRDGTRLLFGSEWGAGSSAPVYDYELDWR